MHAAKGDFWWTELFFYHTFKSDFQNMHEKIFYYAQGLLAKFILFVFQVVKAFCSSFLPHNVSGYLSGSL
jgi:hypothetical protein